MREREREIERESELFTLEIWPFAFEIHKEHNLHVIRTFACRALSECSGRECQITIESLSKCVLPMAANANPGPGQ